VDQDQANKLVAALNAAYPNSECPGCADPLNSKHDTACPGTAYEEESSAVFARLDFTGHAGRECGEHRSTGPRAWCHDCSEWCYRDSPCKGCELPQLRAENERLAVQVDELRARGDEHARTVIALREDLSRSGAQVEHLEFENERLTKRVAALIHDRHRAETIADVARRTFPFVPTEPDPALHAWWGDEAEQR
jgi:hypothetical protein